jgi:hypothetical protein
MTPRDRRALLIGGVLSALLLISLRAGPWGWKTLVQQRTELLARAELLARMQLDLQSEATLEDSGESVRRRLAELAPALLAAKTGSDAAADLSARVTASAERHGVRTTRKDPVVDSAARAGLGQVGLRVSLESDTKGLLGFLNDLRREPSVLVIDDLEITSDDPFVSPDRPELLRSELTVRGWYLSGKEMP